MQFLFYGKPKADVFAHPPENLMAKAQEDQAKSKEYYQSGTFRQLWMSGFSAFVLCEADSREELQVLLEDLPMAKAHLIDIEIFELQPYLGFTPQGH